MTHSTEQPEAQRLIDWFEESGGFNQGTKAPHKWVLQAEQELRRLHARVQELEAERTVRMTQNTRMAERIAELEAVHTRSCEDSKRLDWLDQKNQGHPYYTGYVWQKEGYENNRGLVAAIQSKKEMMSARQAIDAAMRITQEKQG